MKPTDEIINTLRDRLCAVEEASAIKGTMLHESEETIAKLRAEAATLKRQRDELKDGMETLATRKYKNGEPIKDFGGFANAALMSLGSGE